MARARNIKPSLFKNELLGVADPLLTILFESLWCLADKAGRLEDRPLRIKAETFPYREISEQLFNSYLTELERLGFIRRYEVAGVKVIEVLNFSKHQKPHSTEKDSELPEYKEVTEITVKEPLNNGEITQAKRSDSLNTDSLNTDSLGADEPPPPENPLACVADELAIQTVETAFDIRLDLQTRSRVKQAVPPDLIDRFPAFINGRAVGYSNKSPTEKLARIGYALTDFQKDNKQNGSTITTTYRDAREQQAIAERNFYDDIRAELDGNGHVPQTDAFDSGRQLRMLGAKPDEG